MMGCCLYCSRGTFRIVLRRRRGEPKQYMSNDGEVANALVCKTSIHGFKSHSVLQQNKRLIPILDTRKTPLNRFCGEFRYYVNEDVQRKLKTRTFAGNLFRTEADVRRAVEAELLDTSWHRVCIRQCGAHYTRAHRSVSDTECVIHTSERFGGCDDQKIPF